VRVLRERKHLALAMEQQATTLLHTAQQLLAQIAEEEAEATGGAVEQARKPKRSPAQPDGPVSIEHRTAARAALAKRGMVIVR
jgi:hypothetical protein